MEDCEPTFSTEPSSSAMRARPFTWVFTRSSQFTADFAEAVTVFDPRAILTAGITRATSPARVLELCGAALTFAGMAMHNDSKDAKAKAHGDLVFIEGHSWARELSTVVTGDGRKCQLKIRKRCPVVTAAAELQRA